MLNLLLGALAISFSAVFMKLVAVSPTSAAFYRMLFGGLVLAAVVVWRRERPELDRRVLLATLAAAACFALDLAFWHRSILHIGTGLATLLANFQVFLLALAGVAWFGERLDWRLAVAVPLAMTGLALIVGFDWSGLGPARRVGVMLGLATAVCYALYILALRASRAEQRVTPYGSIALISLVSAGLLAALLLAEGGTFVIPTPRDAALLVAYGVVGQVLGWVLITSAVHRVSASMIGLVLLLQPLFAYAWDVAFFDQGFTLVESLGAGLALAAIGLGVTRRV
jgi:drug/metabolite transporter (DMT)-like permease